MAKAPSMPVFVDALVGDTTDLSPEEFGAYCLILFATWRNGGVPFGDEDNRLARICRVTVKRWRERLRPVLARFFDLSDGTWRQGRLEKEWIFVQKQIEQKRCAGTASHKAKVLKNKKTDQTAVAEPLPTAMPTERQQPTPTPKEDSVRADALTAAEPAPSSALRVVHPEPVTPLPPPVRNYVKEAFAKCETVLGPGGRGLIGEAKKLGYNSFAILDALDATEHYCVGEPVGYFRKCLRDTANNMRPASNGENLFEGANRAAEAVIKRHQGSLGDNREDAEPLLDCVGPSGYEAGTGRGLVRRLN